MLGFKRFFYYVFKIVFGAALIGFGALAAYELQLGHTEEAGGAGICCLIALVLLLIPLAIRLSTKCPHCKKSWVVKKTGDEDLGSSSGVFTKKSGNEYHQYEKHKHRLSYHCNACGRDWQKIEEQNHQLD